jgi:type IV pilus assembly protein PilE
MNGSPHARARTRAFTLLELVIALGIAALVATFATAGFERTVLRSHRLDAHAALAAVASAQERHHLEYARYASRFDPSAAAHDAAASDAAAEALPLDAISPGGHYALALETDADALGYRVTARPLAAQRRDAACALLGLDHTGRHTARDSYGADTSATCWR